MSAFVSGLRRELVDAAERERRRHAPRRAAARWTRAAVAAVACAVALAAVLTGIALLGRGPAEPASGAPRIVAEIRVGGQPLGAAVGAGSVWVADGTGRVLRVDPASRRVIATIPADVEADAVAATDEAVWVSTMKRSGYHTVTRIDPATERVVGRFGTHRLFGQNFAAGERALWLQLDKQPPVRLQRLDPRTGRLTSGYGGDWLAAMEVEDGVLWTLSTEGVLERRDADSGRLLTRTRGFPSVPPGSPLRDAVAADAGGAWVVTGATGELHRVSPAGEIERTIALHANAPIARVGDRLWVAGDDVTARKAELIELDAVSGRELGRLRLGARVPRALVAAGGDLWAVIGDGTILVIR